MTIAPFGKPMNFRLTPLKGQLADEFSPFSRSRARSGARWADLSRPVQKPVSPHPQIGERKQRKELLCIFHQAPIANFHITELVLDYPKRMLNLGMDTRFGTLKIIQDPHQRRGYIQRASLTRTHRHMPLRPYRLRVRRWDRLRGSVNCFYLLPKPR